MKFMKEYMDSMLKGEVEVITATDIRKNLGECLVQASFGKTFCIYRKGKLVAFLISPDESNIVHEIHPDGSAPTLGIKPGEKIKLVDVHPDLDARTEAPARSSSATASRTRAITSGFAPSAS